jgi:hypothetical protein
MATTDKATKLKKLNEAVVATSHRLVDAYRALAKVHIQYGHDQIASDYLDKAMKIQKVLRGRE